MTESTYSDPAVRAAVREQTAKANADAEAAEWQAAAVVAAVNSAPETVQLSDDEQREERFDPWRIRAELMQTRAKVTAEWEVHRIRTDAIGTPGWLREQGLWSLMQTIGAAIDAANLAYTIDRTLTPIENKHRSLTELVTEWDKYEDDDTSTRMHKVERIVRGL